MWPLLRAPTSSCCGCSLLVTPCLFPMRSEVWAVASSGKRVFMVGWVMRDMVGGNVVRLEGAVGRWGGGG